MAASRALTSGTISVLNLLAAGLDGDRQACRELRGRRRRARVRRRRAQSGISFLLQPAVGAEDAKRHGQIEAGAFLADVGGREIDGDVWWAECRSRSSCRAERTRSRLSRTAASGRPTVWKWSSFVLMPETSTSTSMMLASIP